MVNHKGLQVTKESDVKGSSESIASECKNIEMWHDSRHVGWGHKHKGPGNKPMLPPSTLLTGSLKNMHSYNLFNSDSAGKPGYLHAGDGKQPPLLLCT